jgi:hypothetical protein
MTGRHKFSDLESGFSPERLAGISQMAKALAAEVDSTEPGAKQQQAQLLELLMRHPSGLTRNEILEKLGLKGNKSGEESIDHILIALRKSRALCLNDLKYRSA